MNTAIKYLEIICIKQTGDFKLKISFNDDTEKEIDFSESLNKPYPVFTQLRNKNEFKKFAISPTGGISWDSGADLCADVLRDSF